MIKPESNAPASMKPWVRTTDKQIEELETAVSKIASALNAGNSSIDHEQNQSLSNTFSFTPLDDGSTVTNSQAMNFTGPVTSESDISIAGSLIVGDPSRQEYDPLSGEAVGSIPNLEVISGQLEINPVTEVEYYTTGELNMTDTSFNVDAYGLIHGDGLQIVLANDGNAERQNIEILGATGTGTAETFQIANNTSNVAIYTAGKYVNITGVDPVGYNGSNLLITSVNTGVSPMTFTVAGTESGSYVGGGYVTINQANSTYEGKLSVQGPAPDYTGVTIEQDGVFIGSNGGDPNIAVAKLDSTGLTAPSAFIDQAVINGTRLFISSTAPTAVNDGDIWIDKSGIFTQGTSYVLPTATSTTLGGVELFSDTVQSVAANAVSSTAGKTYGAQLNSSGQLVVNVPWTDNLGYLGDTQLGGASGAITSITGFNGFTSVTGSTLTIGSTASTGVSGNVFLQSGSTGSSGQATGTVTVKTGDAATLASSGAVSIFSGRGGTSAGGSGSVYLNVGSLQGTGGTGGIGIGNATLANTATPSVINIGPSANTTLPINISGAATFTAVPTLPSTAQQLFLASPTSGAGTPAFRYISTSDFTQSSSPTIGQALVAAPVTGGWSWGGPYLALTGGTLTGNLNLVAPTSTLSSLTFTTGTQPTTASQVFGQVSAGAESVGISTGKTTGVGTGFGIIQAPQMVFSLADAAVAANSTTGVSAFATANDTLSSLEAAKLYRFKGKYYVTYTAGGTAAALQLLFAFGNTATPQAIKYSFRTTRSTSATTFDQVGIGSVATGVSVSTSNQTSGTMVVEFDGYITSHATLNGSLTPQIAASGTTSGGTFVVTTGSWFEIQKIGTATQTLISGNWA